MQKSINFLLTFSDKLLQALLINKNLKHLINIIRQDIVKYNKVDYFR